MLIASSTVVWEPSPPVARSPCPDEQRLGRHPVRVVGGSERPFDVANLQPTVSGEQAPCCSPDDRRSKVAGCFPVDSLETAATEQILDRVASFARDDVARQRWNRATAKGMATLPVPDAAAGLLFHTDSWVIDNLAAIDVPVLQIVGERDEVFLRSTNYMATKLTGSTTTHVVPGAGHHVHRGAADTTNRAIEAFLQGLPPSN